MSADTPETLPRTRAVYESLAKVLDVPLNYLLSDDEAFIVDTAEQYGYRGRKDAEQLVADAATLFAGGDITTFPCSPTASPYFPISIFGCAMTDNPAGFLQLGQ